MSIFADMMAHDGHMAFEKCGDVVVSPKDNKLALFCHFCKDLITNLSQFLRHLHEAHGDVLHFTQEHNVYSVDELLSGEETEDAEEVENNNSQGENCGMLQLTEECEESNKTPDIDLAEEEVEEESFGSTRDVLAEVEAMLLSNEELEENQDSCQQDVGIKAYLEVCQRLQEEKEVSKERTIIPKIAPEIPNQISKGGRNRKEVGLKISRLRSHAIARQSRKRMSTVKKRILRAIDNFAPKKQNDQKKNEEEEQTQSLPLAAIRPRIPPSKTPSRPPVNAGNLSVRKSTLTTARISLQMTTTTTTSSETVVSCSNKEEAAYQTSSQEDTCQKKEILRTQSTHKASPIKIRKIEILPNLNMQNENLNKSGENVDDIDLDKELAALLGSPMRSNSKENKESPSKVKVNSRAKNQKLNRDVKNYTTNRSRVESTSTKVESKLDILLAAANSNPASNTSSSTSTGAANECLEVLIDNCTLLKYVGLAVIHNPSYEDKIMLDELEDLRAKAVKFCKILQEYDEVWNSRRTKPMGNDPQRLAFLIQSLTQDVNAALDLHLSKCDAKRILNLIALWFWRTVDLKHFRKLPLSTSTHHYFNLFGFIPQLTRFLFFCEYCDENFTQEAVYRKHLMSHSFTIRCAICRRAFKGHGYLDKHLRTYHADVNVLEYI